VRILTIHGAKGLEAPVVWLLDANAAPRAQDAWDLLVDWPPQAAAPAHVSFYGRQNERGKARTPLFDAEQAAAAREELNLLYVAITRARQVFIASGIDNAKASAQSPYRLLEAALAGLGGELAHGETLATALPSLASTARIDGEVPLPQPLPAIGERRQPPGEAERFGVLLHALLERRSEGTGDDGWWTALGFADDDYRRVLPVAERILGASVLQRFFDPAQYRRAWNEVDLCTRAGALLRIDRLVELDDGCWVLDYKSSRSDTARLDEYRAQVAEYCSVVADVFPGKAVRGALIFGDATLFEVC
jgi:ATP-dependent helicase/nuclease subunit A